MSDRHLGASRDLPQRRDPLVEVSGTTDPFDELRDARGHLLGDAGHGQRGSVDIHGEDDAVGNGETRADQLPESCRLGPDDGHVASSDVGQGEDRPVGHRGGSADGASSMATSLRGATVR